MALVILEIKGIEGECGVSKYEKMILCDSMSQDIALEIDVSQMARRTFHVPKVENIKLERKMDKATPGLVKSILAGKVDAKNPWLLHCLKAANGDDAMQVEFLLITLKDPILASHSLSVSESDTTESLEINAAEITWKYTASDEANTLEKGHTAVTFDTIAGKIK